MPLPPLPANSTNRAFIKYTTGRIQHELVYRYQDEAEAPDTLGWLDDLLTELQPHLPQTWALVGAEYQQRGSIIRLPFSLGTLQGFSGSGPETLPLASEPGQWNWVGRGTGTGRRVRLGVFGIAEQPPATYRFTGAGRPQWAIDVTNVLASSFQQPLTIGGDTATWYEYVNFNYNSYWETEARQ